MAVSGGLLVSLTGFLETSFDRARAARAERLKPDMARDIARTADAAPFGSMAVFDPTSAIGELTAAIRADPASEETHHVSRMIWFLARRMEVLDLNEAGSDDHPKG